MPVNTHAKMPGFIVAGGDHAALIGATADRDRLAAQARVVAGFDRGIKTVAIAVDDLADWKRHGRRGRLKSDPPFYPTVIKKPNRKNPVRLLRCCGATKLTWSSAPDHREPLV